MRCSRRWARCLPVVLAGLLGCSGKTTSTTAGATTTEARVTAAASTARDSSTSSSTTTSTTVVVATTTTTTTSTTSPTTSPGTTTLTSIVVSHTVEDDVRSAYRASYDAYWACLRAPATCEPASVTAVQGPARASLSAAVNQLLKSSLHVGPDDVGYMVIEAVTVDAAARQADVKSCWWDTGVVYGPPTLTGGPDSVINNKQVTSRFDSTLYLEDGVWKVGAEKRVDRVEGVNQCPAAR